MKKSTIQEIIREETLKVLTENLINKLKDDYIPNIVKNPVAKKVFNVSLRAVKDKKISLVDLYKIGVTLSTAIRSDSQTRAKNAAEAIKHDPLIKRMGFDIEVGDITKKIEDPSLSRLPLPKNIEDERADFGTTWGVSLKFKY